MRIRARVALSRISGPSLSGCVCVADGMERERAKRSQRAWRPRSLRSLLAELDLNASKCNQCHTYRLPAQRQHAHPMSIDFGCPFMGEAAYPNKKPRFHTANERGHADWRDVRRDGIGKNHHTPRNAKCKRVPAPDPNQGDLLNTCTYINNMLRLSPPGYCFECVRYA